MARDMEPSGAKWMGDIPSDWRLARLKDLVRINNGREVEFDDGSVPVYGSGGAFKWTSRPLCIEPALLLGRKGTIDKPLYVDKPFWTVDTMFYAIPKSHNLCLKYLYYATLCLDFTYYESGSTLPSMTQSDLGGMMVPCPRVAEQVKIAEHLDNLYDRYCSIESAVRRQISYLESCRSSTIFETVTKGLDSSVPIKPCEAGWVHLIPSSWRIEPLKYHCSMFKGLPMLKTDLVDEGVPVISYGQIHSKDNTGTHLDESLLRFIPASMLTKSEPSKLRKGDVVFADTSEDVEGIGNAALIDRDSVVYAGYHTVTCRPNQSSLSGRYFAYLAKTDAWRYQLRNLAMGVKVFSITQSILKKSKVLLPPLDEQEHIADFLDERCAGIDAVIDTKRKQLDVLKKRRQSLIYEYVTGKRRVSKER